MSYVSYSSYRNSAVGIVMNTLLVDGRADIKWQDEDDEEAEVPGQQRPQQHQPLLLSQVSIALEEVEGQEENNDDHDGQRSATHSEE